MLDELGREWHYNLYYIFQEDFERNKLPPEKAEAMWNTICCALEERGKADLSMPAQNPPRRE